MLLSIGCGLLLLLAILPQQISPAVRRDTVNDFLEASGIPRNILVLFKAGNLLSDPVAADFLSGCRSPHWQSAEIAGRVAVL